MRYCVQASKTVNECQTYRTKRGKMSFCSPAEVTQEICVVAEQNPGNAQLQESLSAALEKWRGITRVEKPMILAPRYHCETYQYAMTPTGLGDLTVDDKCSLVKSILNYLFG